MEYLIDTVTLVRHLTQKGYLPEKVKNIFERANQGECTFLISCISLMEILYLGEKFRIETTVAHTIHEIKKSKIYKIVDLSAEIILTAQTVEFYELHDRMILATAKYLEIPVISPDVKFKNLKDIEIIWE